MAACTIEGISRRDITKVHVISYKLVYFCSLLVNILPNIKGELKSQRVTVNESHINVVSSSSKATDGPVEVGS